MKLKPTSDRIVVKYDKPKDKTAGGIILPTAAQEKSLQGKIVAVGPGALLKNGKRGKLDLKIGDKVITGKWAGTEITVEGQEYKVMRESDVMAKVQ